MAPKERFSISMDPDLKASLKEHAQAAELDVTRYVTLAVQKQMQEDAVIARRFAAVDAEIAATEALPAPEGAETEVDEAEITAALAGIAHALAPSPEEAA
ncbi:hypothetical protein [Streptomyces sp. NPDC059398]|uniref:hypothetical protein n=1 Tax=Streptomyces sp. NPDC059398 TaxID=3346820 RepID=UPI0036A29C64